MRSRVTSVWIISLHLFAFIFNSFFPNNRYIEVFKSNNEEAMRGKDRTMNAVTGGNRGGRGGGFGGGYGGGFGGQGGGFGSGSVSHCYALFILILI